MQLARQAASHSSKAHNQAPAAAAHDAEHTAKPQLAPTPATVAQRAPMHALASPRRTPEATEAATPAPTTTRRLESAPKRAQPSDKQQHARPQSSSHTLSSHTRHPSGHASAQTHSAPTPNEQSASETRPAPHATASQLPHRLLQRTRQTNGGRAADSELPHQLPPPETGRNTGKQMRVGGAGSHAKAAAFAVPGR